MLSKNKTNYIVFCVYFFCYFIFSACFFIGMQFNVTYDHFMGLKWLENMKYNTYSECIVTIIMVNHSDDNAGAHQDHFWPSRTFCSQLAAEECAPRWHHEASTRWLAALNQNIQRVCVSVCESVRVCERQPTGTCRVAAPGLAQCRPAAVAALDWKHVCRPTGAGSKC